MSADKYSIICARQMEAIVYIHQHVSWSVCLLVVYCNNHKLKEKQRVTLVTIAYDLPHIVQETRNGSPLGKVSIPYQLTFLP